MPEHLVSDDVAILEYECVQQERPTAEGAVRLAEIDVVVPIILEQLAGWWFTSDDEPLIDALLDAGASLVRYGHLYHRSLTSRDRELMPSAGGEFTISGIDRTPAELALLATMAYPPGHADHDMFDADGSDVVAALLSGKLVGPYLPDPSGQVMQADLLVAACIINRTSDDAPSGGPWVSDVFRRPGPRYRGLGRVLLERSIAVLAEAGESSLALVATDGNPVVRLYEHLGFEHVSSHRKLAI
jgi:GNAT superfamily N-acetyltransferase